MADKKLLTIASTGTISELVSGDTLDIDNKPVKNMQNASFQQEHDNGNSGTSDQINWNNSNKQLSTLTGNCTFTFVDPNGPTNMLVRLVQDATGGRTVTWPASVKWPGGTAPTLSTAANAIDIVSFYFDGTNYYGQAGLNFS